ncbi:hypothetical protein [Streptomyces sp. NPDC050485]|uniref:hypothetical protein n=1 Tax=Streptomyces sp. NPDC050485 TaxID=3365617 RepID=UPI003794BEB4
MSRPPDRPIADGPHLLADTLLLTAPAAVQVGDGFEVVLVPAHHARQAVALLDALPLDPVGAIAAVEDRWAFFVPEESHDPPWPPGTLYLAAGARLTLPPAPRAWPVAGWIRWLPTGRILTAPLLLLPVLAAISDRARASSARQ